MVCGKAFSHSRYEFSFECFLLLLLVALIISAFPLHVVTITIVVST
jgi:hypothetical protein